MNSITRAAAIAIAGALAISPLCARANGLTTIPATASSPVVPIYIARPREGTKPLPAVVFLHGCEGFSGADAVAADRIALQGYVGVAIDSIGPMEPQGACDRNDAATATEADDARATLAWLRSQPFVDPTRLALVGFSMGANAILDIIDPASGANAPPAGLRAAAAFYPGCGTRDGNVMVPLTIFDGDADTVTPAPACAAMVARGKAHGKTIAITTYPGATHGFNVPGPDRTFYGQTIRFDPDATRDSALATLAFLNRYLKP